MWDVFKQHPRLILFGFVTAFFSGPGQSFMVSFFSPGMMKEFNLSASQWGSIYMLATLAGSIALPFLGKLLDRSDLLKFTLVMGTLLALGCSILSLSYSVLFVVIGLIFIRCFGQGAMHLVSSTTITRNFQASRGKALSMSSQGFPIAEALMPMLVTFWIVHYGWRSGWSFLASILIVCFFPAVIWLLNHPSVPRRVEDSLIDQSRPTAAVKVFTDFRFYPALLFSTCAPFLLTGLFLFQISIAESKGWDKSLLASAFILFAGLRALTNLGVGFLIDRFSARKLLAVSLVPLAFAILALWKATDSQWAFIYLALAGVAVGMGANIKQSFWAEAYGTAELGAIKGKVAFVIVLSTAISPLLMGWLLDRYDSPDILLKTSFYYCLACIALGVLTSILYRSKTQN